MKKARLIISYRCDKSCPDCCNEWKGTEQQVKQVTLDEVRGYDEVMITGGEPMLFPDMVREMIPVLRSQGAKTVYLYTALFRPGLRSIIELLDGVHYTLHEGARVSDLGRFYDFQNLIQGKPGSFRLYIDSKVDLPVTIHPDRWARLEVFPWMKEIETCLPEGEELLALLPYDSPRSVEGISKEG